MTAFCLQDYKLWRCDTLPLKLLASKLHLLGGNKSAEENEINKEKQNEKQSWETGSPRDIVWSPDSVTPRVSISSIPPSHGYQQIHLFV